ncbi:MAG: anti-sigma factor [Candidatus Eremiobacteraeota bacterium]|nr:anti-sigma factor [Candidatus Eremiobacteraeota bacterium]
MKQSAAWPAYLVAAVCCAIAVGSSVANISLLGQIKREQRLNTELSARSKVLAQRLSAERTALFDLLDTHDRRYEIGNGEVIAYRGRLYLAMHALPQPPRGRIYQAWTLAKASNRRNAAPVFLPDARGVAFVLLPVDARTTTEVSVTLEPEGGSREPTSKPLMEIPFASQ